MESSTVSTISAGALASDAAVLHTSKTAGENNSSIHNAKHPEDLTATQKRDPSMVDFNLPVSGTARKSLSGSTGKQDRARSLSEGGPYRGMGKEELLRFSNRPFWRNLRYICMSVVLTGWLALLIAVVAIVLTYPQCREPQPRDWWQKTVIYRVYVPSFLDSDCDGIGDLEGVRKKLDYLRDLGVNTISLSPIYTLSSMLTETERFLLSDTQVVNHTDIDPIYGSLEDFQNLVNQTHSKGMYIVLDFIPNHTSNEHPWFLASSTNGSDSKTNWFRSFYVWAEGANANQLQVPNNWQSTHDCSAWERNDEDNMFYLHQFMPSQPDLNLRSEKVRQELEKILKFWLDLGVDGFYIRDSNFLFEDFDLRDDELSMDNLTQVNCPGSSTLHHPYQAYKHVHTQGLSENFDMLARWRAYLDDYGTQTNQYKILLADVDGSYENVMDYYGLFNRDGVDFPLNKFSLDLNEKSDGHEIAQMVGNYFENMPTNRWPNWMSGDDRSRRLADRLGEDLPKPYLILAMLLPGTPYFYYGDEIGLRANTSSSTGSASHRAKPMRGPMQWTNASQAGFSKFTDQSCTKAWMPLNENYTIGMNVKAQRDDPSSLWNLFRNLTQLRQGKPSFEYGDYTPLVQDDQVFAFVREFDGEKGYLVALNFASQPATKQLHCLHQTVPTSAKVEIVSGTDALHTRGGSADLDPIKLMPYEGIVVSWDYEAKEL
ncbi:neutral and basic amino acid transport protein rbat [Plakobranchus ocellatus]|uniref:Neutral and basic amino acid transport protein rbat n=1 Tax=Plakobranchus ocellatus TaxID=259542 RepID=A0AAV4CQ64_9GAST|nr:neutral and basic amino acid transport protein rbat [Plakobranchus ocellatus]